MLKSLKNWVIFFGIAFLGIFAANLIGSRAFTGQTFGPQESSLNWSGYVAKEGTFTGVGGTWVVPDVKPTSGITADATWVGIGGVSSDDLIQAGTQAVASETGDVIYRSWIELLPANSQQIPVRVSPGDTVTVSITKQADDNWNIDFAN